MQCRLNRESYLLHRYFLFIVCLRVVDMHCFLLYSMQFLTNSFLLKCVMIDEEIKTARRRMSTLNDKAADLGDGIGDLTLASKEDEKVEVR